MVLRGALAVSAVCVLALGITTPATAAPAKINGSGSSYVALAMQQWVADAQTNGLQVNYLPTGSPQGLTSFGQSLNDYAGTEAEFTALQSAGGETVRGYQYVPDVAGAVAIMYNVKDKADRKVDYLHLSRRTVARIFTGDITNWNDPAISADNKGLPLPDHQINVVYRGGQSGTTGLFYDFIAHTAPDIFGPWAAKNDLPTNVRIIQLDSSPAFAPKTQAFNGSDQIAQYIASDAGTWSIGYDEFGYAKTYKASAAWIQNRAGEWRLPYAGNISAALVGAKLNPDLSQELSGVYDNPDPLTYPISAYSYIVTQCASSGDRATCKGPYSNPGVTETLAKWLRYIACDGQVNMARIGYSPLPANLSQEIANSIGRMQGQPAEGLNKGNCANPRFDPGYQPPGSPADPLKDVKQIGGGATGGGNGSGAAGAGGGGAGNAAGGKAATSANGAATSAGPAGAAGAATPGASGAAGATSDAAAGEAGAAAVDTAQADADAARLGSKRVAGGSADWRDATPAAYDRPWNTSPSLLPLLLLLMIVILPPTAAGISRSLRR